MTDRELIEARCSREGLTIQGWDEESENGLTAKLGRYTVVSPGHEDDGLYEGDDGELTACVVGAAQYNNQRVNFSFTAEGYDEGNDVRDLLVLEPADA